MSQTFKEGGQPEITPVIKDYDGNALRGPHSMALSEKHNTMFFTDSGPLGETSIEKPNGSVFAIDLGVSMLKPVVFDSLAHPTGIAISNDENIIFVSETGLNRLLRIALHPSGVYHTSVFHQFSGRFGPTAMSMHANGLLYVARFDFTDFSQDGLISVLNASGEIVSELTIANCPEITGLYFSKENEDVLYATESTSNALLKILVGGQQ
jgi:sugar lactone lactonase YvrE